MGIEANVFVPIDEYRALQRDAERYRWLRLRDWFDSPLCVVRNPKAAVTPGNDCPSHGRLDEAIDAEIADVQGFGAA